MRYERTIHISVGSSRKSTSWRTAEFLLSDFYKKLSQPIRTEETLSVFLNMSRSKQDELKDVGGFVGGPLDGNRKTVNLRGRDLITLDMDSVPTGKTEEIETKLNALGCGYAFYTTRKHTPSAPRIRVVVPTNRTMTVDEFEPVSRRLAQMIQPEMNWFDPTTFEPVRLMYWPSCSVDSAFLSKYADKPLLDVDAMLREYKDWRDISSWPVVPGVEAKAVSAALKKDPTRDRNEIGAFCINYSITDAISAFLADRYEKAGEGRYTFTGGSTSGGAVVYDDLYLYSHHATDPCSNTCVNAFDMVRLHLFGDLDEDSKPKTPIHKLPSQAAMIEFVRKDMLCQSTLNSWATEMYGLQLQETSKTETSTGTSLAKFMADNEKADVLSEDIVQKLLDAAGVTLGYNEITHKMLCSGVEDAFRIRAADAENHLSTAVDDVFRRMKVKGSNKSFIQDRLSLISSRNRFNPVTDMLVNAAWDGVDRLPVLFEIMGISEDQKLEQTLIRKWMRQCVALAFNRDDAPYGADGVLVLSGAQGIGKTSLVKRLAVRPELFRGGASLSFRDKDTLINATGAWITELGEMERTIKEDEAALKAFITAESDNIRLPYARAPVEQVRRTSFCGTVNSSRYLRDETGNRRLWTVGVETIDLEKLFGLTEDWLIKLWAQVYAEWKDNGVDSFRLTRTEQEDLGTVNARRMEERPGEEEIRELLDPDLDEEHWSRVSSTQIAAMIGSRYPAVAVGKILSNIVRSGEYPGARKVRNGTFRGYFLPISKEINIR